MQAEVYGLETRSHFGWYIVDCKSLEPHSLYFSRKTGGRCRDLLKNMLTYNKKGKKNLKKLKKNLNNTA